MSDDEREKRWFDAVGRHNQSELDALLDEGADINARDHRGYTALHYALTPFGGSPDLFVHLVGRGADINARGDDGLSALDFGAKHVTSGMENNMIAHATDWAFLNGYRVPGYQAKKATDFWGHYRIAKGARREDQGTELHIDKKGIHTDHVSFWLTTVEYRLAKGGKLKIYGDHATEQVAVTLERAGSREFVLGWQDGVTFGMDLLLYRQPD